MFKNTLTAAVAALTLTTATMTVSQPAQAGGVGKFIAAGIVGAVIGGAIASRPAQAYRPAYGGPVYSGCGYRLSPVFDEYGRQVGARRVPIC